MEYRSVEARSADPGQQTRRGALVADGPSCDRDRFGWAAVGSGSVATGWRSVPKRAAKLPQRICEMRKERPAAEAGGSFIGEPSWPAEIGLL